ncbi:MAG: 30S ribosomal protein S13 [Legionellales bacterium]|nr:30S ribosomal protein S13 [Legionellales bacterium]OUX64331.1 MAG: 30S ribosomal protein S13 [Gammaproteobacteria bacterium TMED281]|tara:strand:- start:765 stop:1115 length:351 start_codon:yes stop_codon:yes gene_type:complete
MSIVVAGRILPSRKHLVIALTSIYGIGRKSSSEICKKLSMNESTILADLDNESIDKIRECVGEYLVEGDLRREINMHKKRLLDIGCYRGIRHRKGLPVRGQRTKTNARTRKGKKRG